MYDFHYNFIKKDFDAELLFTDTVSLTYKIRKCLWSFKCKDLFDLFKISLSCFDDIRYVLDDGILTLAHIHKDSVTSCKEIEKDCHDWKFSSNIKEVIKAVLKLFFYKKISHGQKAQKALKAQKVPKALKGTKTLNYYIVMTITLFCI